MIPVEIVIRGLPAPAGSHKAFPIRSGGVIVGCAVRPDCDRTEPWQALIRAAAEGVVRAMPGWRPTDAPVEMIADFWFSRPKRHFGTGRNASVLKASAPTKHTQKPDTSKLQRAIEDALTGVVYVDDAQICSLLARKHWTASGSGCRIKVFPME